MRQFVLQQCARSRGLTGELSDGMVMGSNSVSFATSELTTPRAKLGSAVIQFDVTDHARLLQQTLGANRQKFRVTRANAQTVKPADICHSSTY